MWSIEPKRETVIKMSLVITLSDLDEINEFLTDPRKLQKQVRSIRNSWLGKNKSTWSDTGRATPKAAVASRPAAERTLEKKTGRGPRRGYNNTPKIPCEICHKLIGAQGMHKHLAKHRSAASVDFD